MCMPYVLVFNPAGGTLWLHRADGWPSAGDHFAYPAHQLASAFGPEVCRPSGQALGPKAAAQRRKADVRSWDVEGEG